MSPPSPIMSAPFEGGAAAGAGMSNSPPSPLLAPVAAGAGAVVDGPMLNPRRSSRPPPRV